MSNEPKAGKGIDPEMLAAYIDNRLPPEQRAAVEAQLADDPESRALLLDTLEALDDDEIKALEVKEPARQPISFTPKPQKSTMRTLMIAGGALAAAAAIVLAVLPAEFSGKFADSDVDSPIERLVATVGAERPIEARLTGGFMYGPLRAATRGPNDLSVEALRLRALAAELDSELRSNPSDDLRHVVAEVQLLLGNNDRAIELLEEASRRAPGNSRVLSDLSAAYLERGRLSGDPNALRSAQQAADQAVLLDTLSFEAMHNGALAALLMGNYSDSVDRWQRLLGTTLTGPWRQEAERQLAIASAGR